MTDRQELKALIREVLQEVQQERDEQLAASEYYAAEAAERAAKRLTRERADAEQERQRLEDRVNDLERKGWGR